MNNLTIAFPQKTIEEKKEIAKQFYKNLIDNFIETLKLLSISKKELSKRFIVPHEDINRHFSSGKNIQLHLGHFFNWEYANLSLCLGLNFPVLIVYMPIKNKVFEKLFIKLRTRFNAKMVAATNFRRDFFPFIRERYCIVFVADQNAGATNIAYWSNFFNKPAPFVTGPEKNARLNNCVVYYAKFYKRKRGFYEVKFILLTDEPRSLKEGELTKKMIALTEESINEDPANYLWSHRRWKHQFDPEKHERLMI